jgi:hypothetical protein
LSGYLCFSPDGGLVAVGPDLWDLCRVRQRLAAMELDWNLPSYPPTAESKSPGPLRVAVVEEEANPFESPGWTSYCAGEWIAAAQAIHESMRVRFGGNGLDWLLLAMVYHRIGDEKEARRWYDCAARWMERNGFDDESLARLRAEADAQLPIGSPR